MRVKELAAFIIERESIRQKKEAGRPRPWTNDTVLGTYRFCNVRREDDRVTRWLRANWYNKWDQRLRNSKAVEEDETNPDIWFAAVVARLLNLPESLEAVREYTLPFRPEQFHKALRQRRDMGKKNFNAAYIVSTNGVPMEKTQYLVERVLKPLWHDRKILRYDYETLDSYYEALTQYDGLGSFIAAQVIADLKYIPPFDGASDWSTFAASGPGSRRGLNRVFNTEPNAPWRELDWRDQLLELRDALLPLLPKPIHALHAQDVQNCLCEFDKYERARLGEGTPKQIYKENASGV